jgi:uncharacterized protein YjgD (DUF1641 family)
MPADAPTALNPMIKESASMSVSSVSSYASTSWEEYLEQLRKKQQQKSAGAAAPPAEAASGELQSSLSPERILSELQSIRDEPEKLKARAAELAEETAAAAASSSGTRSEMLGALASDLEDVAESGDLSVIEERLTRRPGGAAGIPPMPMGSRIEDESDDDDEDEDETVLESIKAFLAEIRELSEEEENLGSFDETVSGLSLESLVSKFQTLKESAASQTQNASNLTGEDSAGSTKMDVTVETLISKIKNNLSDQLRARYANAQTQFPSVSLTG